MEDSHVNHPCIFVEVTVPPSPPTSVRPTYVEALVVDNVEPRTCGTLVKRLSSEVPLAHGELDLSHLKRVKRTPVGTTEARSEQDAAKSADETTDRTVLDQQALCAGDETAFDSQNKNKRKRQESKPEIRLEILLGAVSVLQTKFGRHASDATKIDLSSFASVIPLDRVRTVRVPSRLANSEEEWKEFNAVWPTSYFPNKTKEFLEQEMKLTDSEIDQMRLGMEAAFVDAKRCRQQTLESMVALKDRPIVGVVVMCPKTGRVVATASSERELQWNMLPDKVPPNPLSTPFLLAIQAVSRLEREAVVSKGGMQSDSFKQGQYLCTGYDVYSTLEPTVFEAMALVHSRIRRLVFGCTLQDAGSQHGCGGVTEAHVHALPGTNHHYRSFSCRRESDLWELSCSLSDTVCGLGEET